jgi:hypothetical protein
MVNQGIDPLLKDIFEIASWTAAVVGGLVAAFVAIRQMKSNTEQRKSELRWRQANAAKEIIDDMHCNSLAKNAVTMLDWSEGKHGCEFKEGKIIEISYLKDVIPALQKTQQDCSETDQDIAYCFDWFFYFIDRIEHYIRTSLIEFEDVKDVFKPYNQKIKKHKQVFEDFMSAHSYELASNFWKRYDA